MIIYVFVIPLSSLLSIALSASLRVTSKHIPFTYLSYDSFPNIQCRQHKRTDWLLIDGFSEPGGLARTEVTPEGFLFDMGGHVIYSHYEYFDQLLDKAMGTGPDVWSTIERVSYIWIKDRCVLVYLSVCFCVCV